ncbi:glycosyltransferase [Paenibacillus medicaginis]|uniref:Glycosyltransferase n=1 Tax=Paenibacillus medicaginis TaxID=1470560 RepID=A0ABV5BY84_9BACL
MIKVLLVHNYYQQRGGEDKVVAQELELLQAKGIDVQAYSVHNDKIKEQGIVRKALTALETTWSHQEYLNIKKLLMDMKPDVVHVHNFFPLVSPSIYYASRQAGIPVVQTLHNYRLICPAATFMRNNQVCEECLHGSLMNSVKNGCYRNSKVQTLPVASMIKINRIMGTWSRQVNRYIVLTEFAKKKFIQSGLPAERIVVKPNFIKRPRKSASLPPVHNYIVFVGRISAEKGVQNLLEAWRLVRNKSETKLLVIGDGPERERLSAMYGDESVQFLGNQDAETVLQYMEHARYLAVPSIWYEGFPMTIVESYSVGTPVLCSRIGALEEVVKDAVTGFHFSHDNIEHISETIEHALDNIHYQEMRNNVRRAYEALYTEDVSFNQILNIYKEVIEENAYAKTNEI